MRDGWLGGFVGSVVISFDKDGRGWGVRLG